MSLTSLFVRTFKKVVNKLGLVDKSSYGSISNDLKPIVDKAKQVNQIATAGVVAGLVMFSSISLETSQTQTSSNPQSSNTLKVANANAVSLPPSNLINNPTKAKVAFYFFGTPASAANTRKFVVNGIALNGNMSGVWGYKHGAPLASQFRSENGDQE